MQCKTAHKTIKKLIKIGETDRILEEDIKHMLKKLEILDLKIGGILEFRPNPKGYRLRNDDFPYTDAYYIGMRIRGGVVPKK